MSVINTVTWYLARDCKGRFYNGMYDSGEVCWDDDISFARLFKDTRALKGAITKHVKRHPDEQCPCILEWTLDIATAKVIDVAAQATKAAARIDKVKAAQKRRDQKERLAYLDQQATQIAAEKMKLTGGWGEL